MCVPKDLANHWTNTVTLYHHPFKRNFLFLFKTIIVTGGRGVEEASRGVTTTNKEGLNLYAHLVDLLESEDMFLLCIVDSNLGLRVQQVNSCFTSK